MALMSLEATFFFNFSSHTKPAFFGAITLFPGRGPSAIGRLHGGGSGFVSLVYVFVLSDLKLGIGGLGASHAAGDNSPSR